MSMSAAIDHRPQDCGPRSGKSRLTSSRCRAWVLGLLIACLALLPLLAYGQGQLETGPLPTATGDLFVQQLPTAKVAEPTVAGPTVAERSSAIGSAALSHAGGNRGGLLFRQVFVPQTDLAALLGDGIPIRRSDFEQAVRESHRLNSAGPQLFLQDSHYQARYRDGQLIDGHATWNIERLIPESQDQQREGGASVETPATIGGRMTATEVEADSTAGRERTRLHVLPLESMQVACANLRWHDARAGRLPPRLITTPGGETFLAVDGPGIIEFDWTLRVPLADDPAFEWAMPQSTRSQLELLVPPDLQPSCARGVTRLADSSDFEVGGGQRPGDDARATMSQTLAASNNERRWLIDLPSGSSQLRFVPLVDDAPQSHGTWRQASSYELALSGLQWETRITLERDELDERPFVAEISANLIVTGVLQRGQSIPWTIFTQDHRRRLHVVLPRGSGKRRQLTIRAFEKWTWAAGEAVVLPTLRLVDATWLYGTSEVRVRAPLVVTDMRMQQAVLVGVETSSAHSRATAAPASTASGMSATGEDEAILRFAQESEGSQIQLMVSPRQPKVQAEVLYGLQLEAYSVRGQVGVRVRPWSGPLHMVKASLGAEWILDSVDALTEEGDPQSIDWRIVEGPAIRQLEIRFSKPATTEHPVAIRIQAHRGASLLDKSLSVDELLPLHLEADIEAASWIAARAEPTYQLQIENRGRASWWQVDQLPLRVVALIDATERDVIFTGSTESRRMRLRVTSTLPPVDVRSDVEVVVSETSVTETHRIHLDPGQNQLTSCLIRFSEPHHTEPMWSLPPHLPPPTARPVRPLGTASEMPGDAAEPPSEAGANNAWEVSLPNVGSQPTTLTAVFTYPRPDELPISLAAVTRAARQSGTILLRAEGRTRAVVSNEGRLKSLPWSNFGSADTTILGAYRYDADDTASRALVLRRAEGIETPVACFYRCVVRSLLPAQGVARHRATYFLHNGGLRSLQFQVPSGCSWNRVYLDGEVVQDVPLWQDSLSLSLPRDRRSVTITIDYSQSRDPLAILDEVGVALPATTLPVLERHWQAWLPTELAVADSPARPGRVMNWSSRLMGAWALILGVIQDLADIPDVDAPPLDFDHPLHPLADADLNVLAQQMEVMLGMETVGPTWGDQLPRCDAALRQLQPNARILIDAAALRAAGIHPATPLPPLATSRSPRQRGRQRLQSAGLAMTGVPQGLLISSLAKTAATRPLATTSADETFAVTFQKSFRQDRALHWPPVVWSQLAANSNWRLGDDEQEATMALVGWRSTEQLMTRDFATLPVYRPRRLAMFAGWLFLAATLCGCQRRLVKTARRGILLACLAALVSLLVPPPGAYLSSAILWGLLFGLLLRFLAGSVASSAGHAEPARESQPEPQPALGSTVVTGAILLGISCCCWSSAPVAAQGQATRTSDASEARVDTAGVNAHAGNEQSSGDSRQSDDRPDASGGSRRDAASRSETAASAANAVPEENSTGAALPVIVPVDQEQQPTGSYYYVSPAFYSTLQGYLRGEWLASPAFASPLVQLELAEYHGRLPLRPDDRRVRWSAKLRLHTRRAGSPVELPFRRGDIELSDGSCRVDNVVHTPRWSPSGTGLSFIIPQPGVHELELTFSSPINSAAQRDFALFQIPVTPRATCEITMPARISTIELPSARGEVVIDSFRGRLLAELGPTNSMLVRWPGKSPATVAASGRQMTWLQLNETHVSGSFRMDVAKRQASLQVRLGPDVNVVPTNDEFPFFMRKLANGETEVELPWNVNGFDFDIKGMPAIGKIVPPEIRVVNQRPESSWLAVSLHPNLTASVLVPVGKAGTSEFLKAWAGSRNSAELESDTSASRRGAPGPLAAPALVFDILENADQPVLQTHQRTPVLIGETVASYLLSPDRGELRFHANLDAGQRLVYSHRLACDPALRLRSVGVIQDGRSRAAVWDSEATGELTIGFPEPLTGSYLMIITGDWLLPTPSSSRSAVTAAVIPEINLPELRVGGRQAHLYRTPETAVEIAPLSSSYVELADLSALPGFTPLPPRQARLVDAWQWDSSADREPLRVVVRENHPRYEGEMFLRLTRAQDAWSARIDTSLTVLEGTVDLLMFDIGESFTDNIRAIANLQLDLIKAPQRDRRMLVCWLTDGPDRDAQPRPAGEPVRHEFSFEIHFRVPKEAQVGVPDIRILDPGSLRGYVLLPNKDQSQQLSWSLSGLQRTDANVVPARVSSVDELTNYDVYQVANDSFRATLRSIRSSERMTRVELCHVEASYEANHYFRAQATFDIAPIGIANCLVELPAGVSLVEATIYDTRTIVRQFDQQRWIVQLGPDHWPFPLRLVYHGQSSGRRGQIANLPAPRLLAVTDNVADEDLPSSEMAPQAAAANYFQPERTLWTVALADDLCFTESLSSASVIADWQSDLLQLGAAQQLLENASAVVRENPRDEIITWQRPWHRRVTEIVTHYLPSPFEADSHQPIAAMFAQAVSSHDQVRRELGIGTTTTEDHDVLRPSAWRETIDHQPHLLRLVSADPQENELRFRWASPARSIAARRWGASLIVCFLTFAVWRWFDLIHWRQLITANPAGALGGLMLIAWAILRASVNQLAPAALVLAVGLPAAWYARKHLQAWRNWRVAAAARRLAHKRI